MSVYFMFSFVFLKLFRPHGLVQLVEITKILQVELIPQIFNAKEGRVYRLGVAKRGLGHFPIKFSDCSFKGYNSCRSALALGYEENYMFYFQ